MFILFFENLKSLEISKQTGGANSEMRLASNILSYTIDPEH